jgi:hypothetical protein
MSCCIAAYGHALAMAGHSMLVTPERQPNNKLKVQNMNKSPSEYFQPQPKPGSE